MMAGEWARELDGLTGRALFDALSEFLLQADTPTLLRHAPMLAAAIPELAPTVGFDQHSPYHAFDLFTHEANVVGKLPRELTVRWAGLLHDMGKVPTFTQDETGRGHFRGHPEAGAKMAVQVLTRLEAPEELTFRVSQLIALHMTRLQPEREQLAARVEELGWDTTYSLLLLQQADMGSKGLEKGNQADFYAQIAGILEELK